MCIFVYMYTANFPHCNILTLSQNEEYLIYSTVNYEFKGTQFLLCKSFNSLNKYIYIYIYRLVTSSSFFNDAIEKVAILQCSWLPLQANHLQCPTN
jgi:hypothetical protein